MYHVFVFAVLPGVVERLASVAMPSTGGFTFMAQDKTLEHIASYLGQGVYWKEVDEEKELEQAKQLVLEKVTQAFAQKHGRDPTQQERAAIAAAAEAKLQGFTTGSQTGKERRAANREAREKASAAFEKAEGRKPTQAELDEVLAVVAPEAIQTPAKAPPSEVESPTCVADVPV